MSCFEDIYKDSLMKDVKAEYQSNLDKKFKNNNKVVLRDLLEDIRRDNTIPEGTLVIMPSNDTNIRLKILDKDTPHKGFSTPLIINQYGRNQGITPNYLAWYLSHKYVANYLANYAKGSVFIRIPKKVLFELIIPIPKNPRDYSITTEVAIQIEDPFRKLMAEFYNDYTLNIKHERFRTALILAGAMSEAILYQLLIDEKIDKKIIRDDRGLALGKMITYIRLLKLNEKYNFELSPFESVQKLRNSAIHAGPSMKNYRKYNENDLSDFNQIIKFFGI